MAYQGVNVRRCDSRNKDRYNSKGDRMMNIPISNTSLSLEGKVAIITGGGTGIGRAIALEFARAGADVCVAGRRLAPLEEVAKEIKALDRRSLAVQTDVSRKTDVDNLVERTVGELGGVDILVNSAGVLSRVSILEAREDEWDRVINIDLKGCYLCCQALGKRMVEQRKGNIINVSSIGGVSTGRGVDISAYGIAKAGVIRLTKGLAWELGRYNIRVNAIAPGQVRTEMIQDIWSNPERLKQAKAKTALGRLADPSEIATVALFLASDASSNITGQTIIADSGLLA